MLCQGFVHRLVDAGMVRKDRAVGATQDVIDGECDGASPTKGAVVGITSLALLEVVAKSIRAAGSSVDPIVA